MLRDTLLALGLLLTSAVQLRPAGFPLGPGEMCLVIWVLLMVQREVARLGPPMSWAFSRLFVFWLLFAVAESLGMLAALAIGDKHDPKWFLHDLMAYPLIAAASCLSVVEPGATARLRRVTWLLVGLGTASLVLQLAAAQRLIAIPLVDPWYWDRLRGWSANPNQLAFFCAALGLLSLHLAEMATRGSERMAAIACMALAGYVGRLTQSDTLTVVLVLAGPIFLAIKVRVWLVSPERRLSFRAAFAGIVVVALPLLIAGAAPLMLSVAAEGERAAMALSKNGGKDAAGEADLRFYLWGEAISRGLESGLLGLGPGPHLDIPYSLIAARQSEANQPDNIVHPEANGTPNFEAHNTLLDLFTQGGLLADVSFIWLAGTALLAAYKARLAGMVTSLLGLGLFGMNNLIIRQPTFWFAISLCLVMGHEIRRTAATWDWSRAEEGKLVR